MSQVLVSWIPPANLPSPLPANSGFNVRRVPVPDTVPPTPPVLMNTALVPASPFIDTTVEEGLQYGYFVSTVINGVESAESVEGISNVVPPQAPTNVTAIAS